jgi:hypothetical protein
LLPASQRHPGCSTDLRVTMPIPGVPGPSRWQRWYFEICKLKKKVCFDFVKYFEMISCVYYL